MVVAPEIVPGVEGMVLTVTVKLEAVDVPHILVPVMEITPPVVPAVAEIELDVDDPLHPEGKVQL